MENVFGQYKGLVIGKPEIKQVSEDDIDNEINKMLDESKTNEEKVGKAEKGDITNINYEGFVDGVAFQGGKGEGYDLELGSGTFIPGFEDQLIGHEKGEDVEVHVTFPENYQAENLKGKAAVFKCKINTVLRKVKPTLNDDFAKQYGVDSVGALRVALKNKLEYQYTNEAQTAYIERLLKKIESDSKIEVTKEDKDRRIGEMMNYYEQSVSQYGVTFTKYLEMVGMDKKAFDVKLEEDALLSCRMDYIYRHVEVNEHIEATEPEVDSELGYLKQYYHLTAEQAEKFKKDKLPELKAEIVRQKVSKFLYNNND